MIRGSWRRSKEQNVEPTFVGIGVQKCGTTSLAKMLVEMGAQIPTKELHFSWRNGNRAVYLDRFSGIDPKIAFGEFTPNYIFDSHKLFSLSKELKETKFLITLRNPVDRFYSAYRHGLGKGEIPTSSRPLDLLDDILRGQCERGWAESLVWNGMLGPHVNRALRLLGKERVLTVFLEELQDPVVGPGVAREVANYVGLDGPVAVFPHVNSRKFWIKKSGVDVSRDAEVDAKLKNIYQASNEHLAETLGRRLPWE